MELKLCCPGSLSQPMRRFWKDHSFLGYVCFLEFIFRETIFQTFMCLFDIRKLGQRKTLSSQRKICLGFQESVFLENLSGKHFPEVVKNLKMSYYLLIISNLVLKLLITIYILFWIFIFQFHLLKFNFILILVLIFIIIICFSLIIFLLKFFIYQIWSSFFWLLLIFFEIIYEMLIIIIILISSSFIFFIF